MTFDGATPRIGFNNPINVIWVIYFQPLDNGIWTTDLFYFLFVIIS